MNLSCNHRFKNGKEYCDWNIVEAKRCADGRGVQRQVLHLGDVNDSQSEGWCRMIEAFDDETQRRTQLALLPIHREVPERTKDYGVQVGLDAMQLYRPRHGVPAGSPVSCTSNSNSIASGKHSCPTVAKAPVGGTSCRRWSVTA